MDRRRSTRFRIENLIELNYNGNTEIPAEGLDISESGICCRSDFYFEPYSTVILKLKLDGNKQDVIEFEGFVARCERSGHYCYAGIEIVKIKDSHKKKLHEFFASRQSGG